MDKSLGGSAGVKSTVLTGGPTLKQKEKSVKTEKPPKQSKVNGEQEKSSKGMLIILLLLAIASYFV
ncbi:MAG: hypothetical protein L6407_09940 [Candidatus Delongbacteria bacterium]|nr:hypothetical protein [Candidatus Delongbacteria bacterium]